MSSDILIQWYQVILILNEINIVFRCYLFKKIRATKGTFHAKMSTIMDRNCMDLTEAEDIKKRWQEYTEGLYIKDLHDPDNHDGVIT